MRKMTISDYPEIYALWKGCEGIDINEIDESKDGVQKYLERNPDTCFIEERDGKIVGVILAGHDGRRGSIHHLAVLKPYREQGIGKGLLKCAMDALKKQGIRKVGIFVYADNETGIKFWNSQDFDPHTEYFYMDKPL